MRRCEARQRGPLRMETLLRDEYSGRTAARAAILRERRLFETLRHSDPSEEGSLECWDLLAEQETPRLRTLLASARTKVVTLPPHPELAEYWEVLALIWTRAVAAGIRVVVDMPYGMQRDWKWKVERIGRLAG